MHVDTKDRVGVGRLARRAVWLVALAALLGAAGCGGSSSNTGDTGSSTGGGAKSGGALTIAFPTHNSKSLNPATDTKGQDPILNSLAYAPLIHWKPDGTFAPSLAVSWGYVGTGHKVFTLKLRSDAQFSDGSPVTPAAVKTWLTYVVKAKGPFATELPLASVDTGSDNSVTLHLKSADPNMPLVLSEKYNLGFVASPAAVASPAKLDTQTFGAGPYVLQSSESVSGDHYTFIPNEHYFDKTKVHWSKVVAKFISNPATMLAAARDGQIDVATGDPTTADAAAAAGLQVIHEPVEWDGFWIMDMTGAIGPSLADVRLRQALNYAIDRKAIVSALFGKYGVPTSEILTNDGFDPSFQDYYPYDPAKARSLLAAAGFGNGLTLSVLTTSTRGNLGDPLAESVAKYWQAVGVKVKINNTPTADAYGQGIASHAYQLMTLDDESDPMGDIYNYSFTSGALFNQHGWRGDPAIDQLRSQALVASDPSAGWKAMSQRTVTQAYFIPVVRNDLIWYASSRVGGIAFSAASPWPYPIDWYAK